ncbi:outer membrane porin [Synechococcus sp. PROS-9-1]|uniref:iron uptake porin n=1 Tax=Synechococcus sp. PROS-9-1 TaxID=1968775 RepID=UPI0016441DD3|nr:iron uptake porin [Synechococcus sp. PROS-9-1]QNJ31862.1 outer membrane porin [Synechococcus sp. PROS-9-1]
MKLFRQLLVAPAALGLLAPMAANATELNFNGVSDYAATGEQVTSITQFSDVYPTDWAYQALSNLIGRYGCVAGYPNGTYRGNRAMTRFEAAALLNACLDRVTEVTDELKMLMREFSKELAILKGRVDGLEAKVGELEAQQFSTTTKLKGKATFVIGGVNAGGDSTDTDTYNQGYGAVTFNYDHRLTLDTSFTGKDKLRTRLRTGNFDNAAFAGDGNNLTALDTASGTSDDVTIDRLFYKFPVGKELTFIVGPLARNTESLAMWPSKYNKGGAKILDFFAVAGVPGVYNKETGSLIAAYWKQKVAKGDPGFSISANYVADAGEGNNSDSTAGGIMTDNSRANILTQIGWGNGQYGAAAAYRYGQCKSGMRRSTTFVKSGDYNLPCTTGHNNESRSSNSFALNAYWQPEDPGFIPSVSVGWAMNTVVGDNIADGTYTTSQSWFTGLKWDDVFIDGNDLGFAFGQPTFATALKGNTDPDDGNYAFELYYNYKVTDNITVTPAVFYLSRPNGQSTATTTSGDDGQFNIFGALVQTTFKF